MAIVNPRNEDSLSKRMLMNMPINDVNVEGRKLSVRLVFRCVQSKHLYNINDDTMIIDHLFDNSDIMHCIVGYDYIEFHNTLKSLYHNWMF